MTRPRLLAAATSNMMRGEGHRDLPPMSGVIHAALFAICARARNTRGADRGGGSPPLSFCSDDPGGV